MTAICVVQARMGSTRLPGKVLAAIGGMPALELQVRRLQQGVLPIVVATSVDPRDDPIASLARECDIECIRGHEADVLSRFGMILDAHRDVDHVVRLTGDCPFTDPRIVIDAVEMAEATGASHTSNTLIRTFADGFDVEVVAREALDAACREAERLDEREHVTPFIIRRPNRFPEASIASGSHNGHLRLTLDTAADLQVVRIAAAAVADPVTAGWAEIVAAAASSEPTPRAVPHPVDGLFRERCFSLASGSTARLVPSDIGRGDLVFDEPVLPVDLRSLLGWLVMDGQVIDLRVGHRSM